MKKCPFCAEEIQDEAVVCRFCNRNLTLQPGMRGCPFCAEQMPERDLSCPHCRRDMPRDPRPSPTLPPKPPLIPAQKTAVQNQNRRAIIAFLLFVVMLLIAVVIAVQLP